MADIDQIIAGGAGASSRANFSAFDGIADAYYKGRDERAKNDLRTAFKDGVPTDASGNPDFAAMAKTLFQRGGLNEGVAASNLDIQRQKLKYATDTDAAVNGGQPQQSMGPPSTNRNASAVVAAPLNRGGADNAGSAPTPQGGATITQIVAAQNIPNDQLQAASASIARQLGVDPNQPINKDDPQVRNVLIPALQQLKRMGIGQVQPPQGAPQPPQAVPQQQPQQVAQVPQAPQQAPQPQQAPPQPQPQQGGASFDQRFVGLVPPGRTPDQQLSLLRRAVGSGLLPPEVARTYQSQIEAIQKAYAPTSEEAAFLASKRNPGLDDYTASKNADAETAKAVAASNVKEQQSFIEGGKEAQHRLTTLNTVANIVQSDKNLTLGFGAETALKVKKALQQIGLDMGDLSGAQAIEKMNAQLASEAAKSVSSRPAQFEFKTFLNNNPGLNLDKAGNLRVLGIFSQLAKRDVDLGRLARQNRDNWQNWDNVIASYDKQHPILDPVTKTPISTDSVIAPGTQQRQTNQAAPAAPTLEPGKTMVNGYRYKGGNPKDRASWEQAS